MDHKIKVGQCTMDLFSQEEDVQRNMSLNYNRLQGLIDISSTPIIDDEWTNYNNLYFEHSDTCPSKRNRLVHEKLGQSPKIGDRFMRMAVCCYILDKTGHLLLTRRPSWLSSFP